MGVKFISEPRYTIALPYSGEDPSIAEPLSSLHEAQ